MTGVSKVNLARLIQRLGRVSRGAAAEKADRTVYEILSKLKQGETVELPGLGHFTPGKRPRFRFLEEPKPGQRKGGKE
jgi:nucleoid DNA-binding protein